MKSLARMVDPRRSLASAVGWLTAGLSLAIAVAVIWFGNVVRDRVLASRDTALEMAAEAVAAEVDRALAARLQALDAAPATAPSPAQGSDLLAALRPELQAIVVQAHSRLALAPRQGVLLLDNDYRVLADSSAPAAGAGAGGRPMAPLPAQRGVAVQRLENDKRQVAVLTDADRHPTLRRLGLQLMAVQPSEASLWRGGVLQQRLAWLSLGVCVVAALVGIALARRLTRRLTRLTSAVVRIGSNPQERLDPPPGEDEVAELGRAFAHLVDALCAERDSLNALTADLEQRVQARTREVERLAADSRYAAVVRERLRLARDLHDTLAHSMMAMLAEIRTLRRMHAHDPAALSAELERAEQVAHEGLAEVRAAINQMRLNVVRDLGLGPSLGQAVERFADRTGIAASYASDPHAASFADSRAETVFRIAEEVLRNVERHAHASHVTVALRDSDDGAIELTIADDGIGFDPTTPRPGHFGVVGMHEQAQLIGADLSLTSAAQRGTTVRLHLRVGPEMGGQGRSQAT
jgi:signal transduction histidine kinase